MPLDQWISLTSAFMSFIGLLFVAVQLHHGIKQRESEALVKILDVNRELLSLGFVYPQLYTVLADAKGVDHAIEKHYLQLWLNQFALIHYYMKRSVVRGELRENLERDIFDMLRMHNMRKHWREFGTFYPSSFKKYVNGILEGISEGVEPPLTAAQVNPAKSGS
ncbi:MAG: hypothetical protein JWM68_2076 [Verrucomicrobiales bacterium]|nr:hypothetical protein [Verrucomicrobiales bacterium]